MKYWLMLVVFLIGQVGSADAGSVRDHVAAIAPQISAARLGRISRALEQTCRRHGLNCRLFTAIIAQESMFRVDAYNPATKDYGIGQVNRTTAAAMGLCEKRLREDLEYSLEASARIYVYFRSRYKKSEPDTWYCRYNVGTGKLRGGRAERCVAYLNAVRRFL